MEKDQFLKEFLNLSIADKQKLINATKEEQNKQQEEKIRKFSKEKEKLYKGHCYKRWGGLSSSFPEMWGYYKILNFRYGGNQNCPEALFFTEYPVYWYGYQRSQIGCVGDYFLGATDFDGIQIIPVHDFLIPVDKYGRCEHNKNLIEITQEEYNDAMRIYIERLIDLDFICDHYRGTGVRPDEERWKSK